MLRWSIGLAALLMLSGCAQHVGPQPSYAGLSSLSQDDDSTDVATSESTSEALRHVQSNKVLGAMAFQKVTGQTVDPDSLKGRE